jgi:pimeloyl-ACP methyl ester carboxylesterase
VTLFSIDFGESIPGTQYDTLGHGGSNRPDEPLSLQLFSDQLRDLLSDLDIERCAVLGFSLGGMINRRFAMGYPGRTSGLVILNSPHERSIEAQQLVEERARASTLGGPATTIEASMERWFTPKFLASNDPLLDEVRTWILGTDPETFAEARQVLASGVTELIRPVQPIETPALVITCENDSGSSPDMTYAISR